MTQLRNRPGKYTRINKDDLRKMMHASHWSKHNEKLVLDTRDSIMVKALRQGMDVIIDDTNLHPKHEARIQEVVQAQAQIDQAKYKVEVKPFLTSLEECIKRNKYRPDRVDEKVIRDMWKQFIYEPPAPVEQHPSNPSAVIFDLDGTLALMGDRNPYDASESEWDELNSRVYEEMRSHKERGHKIIICSGRSDEFLEQTDRWLGKHGIEPDMFLMRKKGDTRQDAIVKREMLEQHILPRYYVEVVYDDRNRVVDMWREAGLICFQVADGNF